MTPAEIARFLASAARAAPSADNSQPLDFSWDGRLFSVAYNRARGKDKLFGPHSHATLLAVGACIENIETALASLGLSGELRIDAMAAPERPYAQLSFEGACDSIQQPSDLALFKRHTNRFPFQPAQIPGAVLAAIAGLAQGATRLIVLPADANKAALVGHARLAAEARFCTRELHEWLMGSLRFTPAEINGGEGLDIHTLDLPPGGSMFMRFMANWKRMVMLNRFGTYKALAAVETRLLGAAPALVCIVGRMGPGDAIAAGRLLANLWSKLNAEGVAVHPYYVITDQLLRLQSGTVPPAMVDRVRGIQEAIPRLLGLRSGESLHMVLRIGLPEIDPPRARHLPLSAVYRDLCEV